MIRDAATDDVDQLVDIENQAFASDRLTRERFLHLLKRANAVILVSDDEASGRIDADAVYLFRQGFSVARLYSLAVRPRSRGRGLARALMHRGEEIAVERGCLSIRLEVAEDNTPARTLYERDGYRRIGRVPDYYEDGQAAIRYEKLIVPHERPQVLPVPFYAQTLDFTCGPACVLMAMRRFDSQIPADRELELDIWRESTLIFMTSGLGGCGPFGLGVAALRRGFRVEIYQSDDRVPFIEGVRSQEKKEVIQISHLQMRRRAAEMNAQIRFGEFGVNELIDVLDRGFVPIVLVSGYRLYGQKTPHWVLVTGYDDRFFYVHDPYIPDGATEADSINLPISRRDFARIKRYGKSLQRAMIAVGPRPQ